jgi:hypothetical protein
MTTSDLSAFAEQLAANVASMRDGQPTGFQLAAAVEDAQRVACPSDAAPDGGDTLASQIPGWLGVEPSLRAQVESALFLERKRGRAEGRAELGSAVAVIDFYATREAYNIFPQPDHAFEPEKSYRQANCPTCSQRTKRNFQKGDIFYDFGQKARDFLAGFDERQRAREDGK